MTQLDLFKATIAHEPHEKCLFHLDFTPEIGEKFRRAMADAGIDDFAKHYGVYQPVFVAMRSRPNLPTPDYMSYYKEIDLPEGAWIDWNGVLHLPGSSYHFTRYIAPLRNATTLDEIARFPFADPADRTDDGMAEAVRAAHDGGRVAYCSVGHMYEDAWQVRGYEEFLMDMVAAPENCEYVLDRYMERNLQTATAAAKAGVDVLMCGDDVASQRALMFRREDWRRFMKSRWAKVYAAARVINPKLQIWYHSDGNIEEILPELIEIGVTILNPVQPECMDVVKLKREYGRDLVFDGTIGTQSTMPFGDPAEVKRVVRENRRTLGADGALILAPTHVLEPEVPVANIIAFLEAASE